MIKISAAGARLQYGNVRSRNSPVRARIPALLGGSSSKGGAL
jgi:hypothetical protein